MSLELVVYCRVSRSSVVARRGVSVYVNSVVNQYCMPILASWLSFRCCSWIILGKGLRRCVA